MSMHLGFRYPTAFMKNCAESMSAALRAATHRWMEDQGYLSPAVSAIIRHDQTKASSPHANDDPVFHFNAVEVRGEGE